MRDQYAGDVSDLLKFAFLRALAGNDRRLGIVWYYLPGHDGREDGRHLEWKDESAWWNLDPVLHAGLSLLPERSISALESAPIWPKKTLFFHERVPTKSLRDQWCRKMVEAMGGTDIVFLDPDNGLGNGDSQKHAAVAEIRPLLATDSSVVFISFPGRSKSHIDLVRDLHDRLKTETGVASLLTLRTNVSVPRIPGSPSYVQRQRWFTLIDPNPELIARTRSFSSALATIPRVTVHLEEN